VYGLLLGALLVVRASRGAAAGRRRLDLLDRQVEYQALAILLHVENDANHGTRTHRCVDW
jgi:hypothetical protein